MPHPFADEGVAAQGELAAAELRTLGRRQHIPAPDELLDLDPLAEIAAEHPLQRLGRHRPLAQQPSQTGDGFVELAHAGGVGGLAFGHQARLDLLLAVGAASVDRGAALEFGLEAPGAHAQAVAAGAKLAGVGFGEGGVEGGEDGALADGLPDAHLDGLEDGLFEGLDDDVGQRGDEATAADDELVDLGEGGPQEGREHQRQQGVQGDAGAKGGRLVFDGLGVGEEVGQQTPDFRVGGHAQR